METNKPKKETGPPMSTSNHHVVIVGGGTAGITVAAQLSNLEEPPSITLVDPASYHYYQPLWTLVGGGVFNKEITRREQAEYIPYGVDWVKEAATDIDPVKKSVTTNGGKTISYDYLVVCPGIKLRWDGIPGLKETVGKNRVCSNYAYDQSEYTWETLRRFKGGTALFTQPAGPFKCGGAPQKILYLAADHLRRKGLLKESTLRFFTPGTTIFGVEKFRRALEKVIDRYGIDFNLFSELIEVRGEAREAVVRHSNAEGEVVEEKTYHFDMLHVVPPQSAPDFIRSSVLANEEGWVNVNQYTLQHNKYPDVFSLGDASSSPNAKTGAAVRKQAPVVVHNLLQVMETGALDSPKLYDGYSSCPLVTGYGKLVLAEFDFDNNPLPSFPFDTAQERYSMYALKAYALPDLYWNGMLRGRM